MNARRSKAVSVVPRGLSYTQLTERACNSWRDGKLTLAVRLFGECAAHKRATESTRQDWLDMAEGCKVLASQMKTPEDFYAACSACGHSRYWHTLVIACIQCLNVETGESKCRAFVPYGQS